MRLPVLGTLLFLIDLAPFSPVEREVGAKSI
jgi:hypothetical protein